MQTPLSQSYTTVLSTPPSKTCLRGAQWVRGSLPPEGVAAVGGPPPTGECYPRDGSPAQGDLYARALQIGANHLVWLAGRSGSEERSRPGSPASGWSRGGGNQTYVHHHPWRWPHRRGTTGVSPQRTTRGGQSVCHQRFHLVSRRGPRLTGWLALAPPLTVAWLCPGSRCVLASALMVPALAVLLALPPGGVLRWRGPPSGFAGRLSPAMLAAAAPVLNNCARGLCGVHV
jgi:hypothetical protein